MGQSTDALREQREVITLAPKSASDWSDLGVMEARSGDRAAARRDFEHALALDPTFDAAKANLSKL
jgi:Flp pilus assembly protein TadD